MSIFIVLVFAQAFTDCLPITFVLHCSLVALAPQSMSAVVEAVVSLFVTASADSWKDKVFVEGLEVGTAGRITSSLN